MDRSLRSILWILVALVVLSSVTAGWFFITKERLYAAYTDLEGLFRATVERLNMELSSVTKENVELNAKLEAVHKEFSSLESRHADLRSQYQGLLDEKDELKRELGKVKKGKYFVEKKLKDMESDRFLARLLEEKTSLDVELARLKGSLAPKEEEIENLKRENMDLGVRLAKVIERNDYLASKLEDSKKVAEILSRDVLSAKDAKEGYEQQFETMRAESQILKTKVVEFEKTSLTAANLLAEKENAQLKASSLEREIGRKNEEIEQLKVAIGDRGRGIKELRAEAYHSPQEVELPPIVLQRQDYGSSRNAVSALEQITRPGSLEGKIVTVNREHSFVVIDLGEDAGVGIGTVFNVYRDNLWIGSIESIQTRQKISACDIKDVKENFSIEISDIVVKR